MIDRSSLRHAARELMRRRFRSLLSTLGVMFGVMAIVATLAVAEGAKRDMLDALRQIGANTVVLRPANMTAEQQIAVSERQSTGLTLGDLTRIRNGFEGAEAVAGLRGVRATVEGLADPGSVEVVAATASLKEALGLDTAMGRFLVDSDVEYRRQVVVLGADAARQLNWRGVVGAGIRVGDRVYRVVGVLRDRPRIGRLPSALSVRDYNRAVIVPIGADPPADPFIVNAATAGRLSEVVIRVLPQEPVGPAAEAIRQLILRNHNATHDFMTILPRALIEQEQASRRLLNGTLAAFAAVLLLIGGIGISNIMLANVTERTREIGIRRAIGASERDISLEFISEAVLLTFAGGVLGTLFGIVAAIILASLGGWRVAITPWSIMAALGMAALVGILAGYHPARAAARLNPVEALRHS